MKKKHDPPLVRERVPAMFVGDAEPAPPPAAVLPPQASEAAALLPDDLRVVMEGASANRVWVLAALLLVVVLAGLAAPYTVYFMPTPGERAPFLAGTAAVSAVIGWLGHRYFVKHRKEYRLADDGIVLEVWHGADGMPWVTRIPWTEIEDYTVSVAGDVAFLRVASVRGYTISLRDAPPQLSTRELIRHFIGEAERHPRAVRPRPSTEESDDGWGAMAGEQDLDDRTWLLRKAGIVSLVFTGWLVNALVDPPVQYGLAILAALFVAAFGVQLYGTLNDPEAAGADSGSPRLMARLRRWLRRVLNIRGL